MLRRRRASRKLRCHTPPGRPKGVSTLAIRPALRYDRALNGTHLYGDDRDGQFTLPADVILGF